MIIEIPNDIKSEFDGYNYILDWLTHFKNVKNNSIEFDFSKVQFFEANLAAIIGVVFEILESNGNKVSVKNYNRPVETILRKNGFLIPFGFDKIEIKQIMKPLILNYAVERSEGSKVIFEYSKKESLNVVLNSKGEIIPFINIHNDALLFQTKTLAKPEQDDQNLSMLDLQYLRNVSYQNQLLKKIKDDSLIVSSLVIEL